MTSLVLPRGMVRKLEGLHARLSGRWMILYDDWLLLLLARDRRQLRGLALGWYISGGVCRFDLWRQLALDRRSLAPS